MDDLNALIGGLLSDPETMGQLRSILGFSHGEGDVPEGQGPPLRSDGDFPGGTSSQVMDTALRLLPLLEGLDREDDSTRLLQALRPFLGEERKKKLDEALRILKLLRLLPLLGESGLLSGLL